MAQAESPVFCTWKGLHLFRHSLDLFIVYQAHFRLGFNLATSFWQTRDVSQCPSQKIFSDFNLTHGSQGKKSRLQLLRRGKPCGRDQPRRVRGELRNWRWMILEKSFFCCLILWVPRNSAGNGKWEKVSESWDLTWENGILIRQKEPGLDREDKVAKSTSFKRSLLDYQSQAGLKTIC